MSFIFLHLLAMYTTMYT